MRARGRGLPGAPRAPPAPLPRPGLRPDPPTAWVVEGPRQPRRFGAPVPPGLPRWGPFVPPRWGARGGVSRERPPGGQRRRDPPRAPQGWASAARSSCSVKGRRGGAGEAGRGASRRPEEAGPPSSTPRLGLRWAPAARSPFPPHLGPFRPL
ncbi:basic proline-rich protein-like [Vulpes lagopus]|uniref:basic proline-rich protein-like n=1 Tax=Vulpes lagopus TaxID=494514 RepID=UPI001BC8D9FB|nr:basic proline-rich protein-like [Vulpes lagopus]